MTTHYRLRDYSQSLLFEKEHPRQLRWSDSHKLWMLQDNDKCQGIWIKDKNDLVGEMIVTWDSKTVLHGDSFTVLPEHRGKGIGTTLIEKTLEWGEAAGFKHFIGEARMSNSSWKLFQVMGAKPICVHEDWAGTKENYMLFKIDI